MGAVKLIIEVDMADPAAVSIGGHLAGGRVTAIRLVEKALVSASQVAQQYGVSTETARRRLAAFNQGTNGKFLFDPAIAAAEFEADTPKRGRPRKA